MFLSESALGRFFSSGAVECTMMEGPGLATLAFGAVVGVLLVLAAVLYRGNIAQIAGVLPVVLLLGTFAAIVVLLVGGR